MGKSMNIGVGGVARRVVQPHVGVGGVARAVKNGYIGVGGVARRFFGHDYTVTFQILGTDNQYRTLNDSYSAPDGGAWRFYLDSTGTRQTTDNPHRAVVDISGELGGRTVTLTARRTATNIVDDEDIDAAKAVCWGSDGELIASEQTYFTAGSYQQYTFTLPDEAKTMRLGVWLASAGTAQIELEITDLEIAGEVLI